MKAVYLAKAQELFLAENSALQEPLVSIKACGVCQSDFKAFSKPPANMKLPRVLGHEIAGVLTRDIPSDGLSRGDRVVLWPAFCCGECHYCKRGIENLCPEVQIFGYHLDGGFQAGLYHALEGGKRIHLFKIPENVSFEEAVFAEPLACILNALQKVTFTPRGCLVVGAGVMGRLAIRAIKALFQTKVFTHDTDAGRQLRAEVECQSSKDEEADLLFIAASTGAALEYGLNRLSPGGVALLFSGMDRGGTHPFSIPHNSIHQKEQLLVGAYGCAPHHLRKALKMMETGTVSVADLISRKVALSDLPHVLGENKSEDYKTIVMISST